MKRLFPVIAALCLICAAFLWLPKSSDDVTTLSSLADLDGLKVGVQSGVGYEEYLAEQCPNATPVLFNDFEAMNLALLQGKLSAVLTESVSFPVDRIEHPTFATLDGSLAKVGNHVIVNKDSGGRALLQQLNEYIAKYTADGTYDRLYKAWFTDYDRGNTFVDTSGITGENGKLVFTAEAGYEPVCFAGEGGRLQGFDVDFIYHFCREYGYEPEILPLEYDAMSAAIVSGRCTAAIGIVKDDERAEEVEFSDAYNAYDVIAIYNTEAAADENLLESLKTGFEKTFLRENRWKMFLEGIGTTLLISALSVLFGTLLGLLIYLWCLHGKKAERRFTAALCWLMNSTPTVVLLMVMYYLVFSKYAVSNIAVAVICFTLQFGCSFYARIVSGIAAVGPGQEEAAISQGFNRNQVFFYIQFPQAARHFMPDYQGDIISLILETAVVGYITVMDLTKMSDLVRTRTYAPFFPLIATACIYFLLIWIMTGLLNRLSGLLNRPKRLNMGKETGR